MTQVDMTQTMARRVALVTGGTRGIGLGIARALAGDGWNLALCGVRPESDVREVIDELRAGADIDVAYAPADLAVRDDRARLIDFVYTRFGRIDALVNNAGRAPRVRADLLDATEESFEEVMQTNLQGPYFLTQQIAARMVAHQATQQQAAAATDAAPRATPHAIVFVTSVSADMASPNRGEYCVSKAGLAMAVKLFATRLAEHGIPVYEVRPGVIATDMTSKVKDVYDQRIAGGLIPDRRWGMPEDVGRAVAALLRGDVPYATGTILHVDGGLSIPRL